MVQFYSELISTAVIRKSKEAVLLHPKYLQRLGIFSKIINFYLGTPINKILTPIRVQDSLNRRNCIKISHWQTCPLKCDQSLDSLGFRDKQGSKETNKYFQVQPLALIAELSLINQCVQRDFHCALQKYLVNIKFCLLLSYFLLLILALNCLETFWHKLSVLQRVLLRVHK